MKIEKVKISEVSNNPNNPRVLKDDKFKKLVNSIKGFPQMLEIRPIVVNNEMIVLGGNMRLKACIEAGLKEVHIIKAENLTKKQQDEFIIKDNVSFGEWDWNMIANEWEDQEVESWGLDLPISEQIDNSVEDEIIEITNSLQVIPKKEYIIIMADESSDEWDELKTIFKCETVRMGGCRLGSSSEQIGTERVFDLETFKKRVLNGL